MTFFWRKPNENSNLPVLNQILLILKKYISFQGFLTHLSIELYGIFIVQRSIHKWKTVNKPDKNYLRQCQYMVHAQRELTTFAARHLPMDAIKRWIRTRWYIPNPHNFRFVRWTTQPT